MTSNEQERVRVNYAHRGGYTTLAVSPDGRFAYTGGEDCAARVWDLSKGPENEPLIAFDVTNSILAVAASPECWFVGDADSVVTRYTKESTDMESTPATVSLPVRSLAVDYQGKKLAIASDDLSVRVMEIHDTLHVSALKGHKGGVRRVTWHPSAPLVTTSGFDGQVMVWDVSSQEPVVLHSVSGIIPAVNEQKLPDFQYDCSAVWHPSGDYFLLATEGHDIVSISRADNWARKKVFTNNDDVGAITALAISSDGQYLATAVQTVVTISSLRDGRIIDRYKPKVSLNAVIMQLAFSSAQNLLLWTDSEGSLSWWKDCLPAATVLPSAPVEPDTAQLGNDLAIFGDEPEDINLDDAEDEAFDEDFNIETHLGLQESSRRILDSNVKEMVSITKAQPPFQPGATPLQKEKRYLAFSVLGTIDVTEQDTHHVVNVEFFDRSARRNFHFSDYLRCDKGYLGERGALFSCDSDKDYPAQVQYKPYGQYTSKNEWTYALKGAGVSVLGIAAGGIPPSKSLRQSTDSDLDGFGNVVIATSDNDLTFLSGSGRERRIIGLAGDFVTMTAGPEWVCVVYRSGSTTIDGSQNLSYSIINFDDFSVRQRDALPLPKGHTLKWLGVSDQGAPVIYDSAGRLHVLTKYRIPHHGSWARVLDTRLLERREGKDESYWPVGVSGNSFMCVILKGRQEYPGFPTPLMQELPLQLPFRRDDSKAEEMLERELLFVDMERDNLDEELTTQDIVSREHALDKELIKLIQAACKSDNVSRALELTKLLHNMASIDSAMKVANFYHLKGVEEKMRILKQVKEDDDDRLEVAREKRRRWNKVDEPLRRLPTSEVNQQAFQQPKPFQDFGPPAAVPRPGLSRALPSAESSRLPSLAPESISSSWNELSPSSPGGSGKRKRDEPLPEESFASQSDFEAPPPKLKGNPFARKTGNENNRNPFARKTESNKVIQKSESFFEKVDAAETTDGPKSKKPSGKAKQKDKAKEGPRQATLFGMLPPKQGTKANGIGARTESQTTEMSDIDASTLGETQIDDEGLVETQLDEDTQPTDDGILADDSQMSVDS